MQQAKEKREHARRLIGDHEEVGDATGWA